MLPPEREPRPLWPRPAVLPWPEPIPRPIRFLRLVEPGAGLSSLSFIFFYCSALIRIDYSNKVAYPPQHPFNRRCTLQHPFAAELAQTQTFDCLANPLFGPDRTAN